MPENFLRVDGLRCEHRANPLGIDAPNPRLGWIIHSRQNGTMQSAYRVLAASSWKALGDNRGDLWDSGRVESDKSVDILYRGRALKSRERCFWKVKVWDNHVGESRWSESALWSMGLLDINDWHSQWIGLDKEPYARLGSKYYAPCYFRKEFVVKKKVAHATLYASALGWYMFHINAKRVGNDYFTPGWTDPRVRIYYNTYDVTGLIRKGANAIGGALSGGWYHWPDYGEKARLMCQLEIYYADGSKSLVVTGKSWAASEGPEKYAHILYGELCDARRSIPGWDKPGFDDSKWEKPKTGLELDKALKCMHNAPARPVIEAYPGEPVRVFKEHRPVAVTNPIPHEVYIFDMGSNYAGFVRIKVKNPPKGQAIRLRFGDWLHSDGSLYNENLRGARPMTDEYICSGRPEETWQPRFTFRGHRYVEVTGWPGKPDHDSITGIELTQDVNCSLNFSCGNAMLNKLHEALAQTRHANTIEAPTDCSQRNERQGWGGDALLFSRTANYLADMQAFYRKWLRGVLDAQHECGGFARLAPANHGYYAGDSDGMPAWADIGVLLPWYLYRHYGDAEILAQFYPAIVRYLKFRLSTLKNYLCDNSKFYYGDWNALDMFWNAKKSEWGADSAIAYAAYTALAFRTAAGIASVLRHADDAANFMDSFGRIKKAFNKAYVGKNGMKHPTQGNCALALSFNLIDEPLKAKIARQLVMAFRKRSWNIGAGILSAGETLFALSGAGHLQEAYNVLLNDTFPSWGYMVRCGSPAIWEHWGARRPELRESAEMFDACASGVRSG
ncbi:MAG: family 78 glycoside hydrolase catalytic domain, partial [Kiritimatiellia bacterium]